MMKFDPKEKKESERGWRVWFKRIGFAGFLFFLIKGLIWLAVFLGLTKYFS